MFNPSKDCVSELLLLSPASGTAGQIEESSVRKTRKLEQKRNRPDRDECENSIAFAPCSIANALWHTCPSQEDGREGQGKRPEYYLPALLMIPLLPASARVYDHTQSLSSSLPLPNCNRKQTDGGHTYQQRLVMRKIGRLNTPLRTVCPGILSILFGQVGITVGGKMIPRCRCFEHALHSTKGRAYKCMCVCEREREWAGGSERRKESEKCVSNNP